MDHDRRIVLEKICLLLDRSLEPQQVYEWALGFVVSDGYEAFAKTDPLAAKAAQALLDINEDRMIDSEELKILEYYRQCLSGQREYVPLEQSPDLPDLSDESAKKWKMFFTKPPKTQKEKVLHSMRIYVYVFAAGVLLLNFLLLFQMGGPWSRNRASAAITFPFFIYGFLLLLPMQVLASARVFLVSLVLFILALAYFWWTFFQVVLLKGFHIGSFFWALFFGAVPASVALWLLIYEKYFKKLESIQAPSE